MARHVGLHRKTVAQYVHAASFVDRARPPSLLDPYKPYLLDSWNKGCRTGMRLYEAIQRQGYRGGRSTVLGYLTPLRKAQGLAPRTRTGPLLPPITDPTGQAVTPRQATWFPLRQPQTLTEDEQHQRIRVHQAHPAFAQALALAQGVAQLLRARQPERRDAWLSRPRRVRSPRFGAWRPVCSATMRPSTLASLDPGAADPSQGISIVSSY
ncbi:MAG: hypothetical protein FJZ47_09010 [Candidatus Tectomicrobia bacterium]|uniref:HTH IS21-type domain-containing protein n=1 Tax=Tectimicrobiota bacterium TaxID=2528274 RepID=A0A937W1B8_UNCTE|nr:hypothetical protein [Candidatus Tectomicrobia bacterium]